MTIPMSPMRRGYIRISGAVFVDALLTTCGFATAVAGRED